MVKATSKNKVNKKAAASSTKKPIAKKVAPNKTNKAVPKKITTQKATSSKKTTATKKKQQTVTPVAAKKKVSTSKKVAEVEVKKNTTKPVEKTESKLKSNKIIEIKNNKEIVTEPKTAANTTKVSVLQKVVEKAKVTLKNVSTIAQKPIESINKEQKINKSVPKQMNEAMKPVDIIKDVVNILNNSLGKTKEKEGLHICPNCKDETNCKRRQFSEQALTVLLLWGEIQPAAVDLPICDDCYNDMRGVLIDRVEEIEGALKDEGVSQVRQIVAKIAS